MKLSTLLQNIEYTLLYGEEKEITGIAYDSRKVKKGDLFVCITGFQTDGHNYAQKAIEAGAVAILCEKEIDSKRHTRKRDCFYSWYENRSTERGTFFKS